MAATIHPFSAKSIDQKDLVKRYKEYSTKTGIAFSRLVLLALEQSEQSLIKGNK